MKTVRLDGGRLLDRVYQRILVPSFRPDELDSLASLRRDIRTDGTLGAAVVDGGGQPVAVAIGDWSPDCRVMLLSYLAVAEAARGRGIGGSLYDEVVGAWRADYRPCLIVAEVEHPDHHRASPAYGDPAARLRFYGRHGARILDLPYFQPALGPGRSRVYGMLLLALHVDPQLAGPAESGSRVGAQEVPARVAADPLRAFLTDYWQVEGGLGDDPATAALFAAVPAGGGVALLPTEGYREVPVASGARSSGPSQEETARAGQSEQSGP